MKKMIMAVAVILPVFIAGCSSVPLASDIDNKNAKLFPVPKEGEAGLYIYRDSFVGQALRKDVYLNGGCVGETSNEVFFYLTIPTEENEIILGTESEFSPNNITMSLESGKNHFVRQYIKMGVFVGGAGLEQVSEEEGKRVISKPKLKLAAQGICDI
ncbi:DUF2846 domain-containing protein [Ignatzschineria rhizosphaerae]|uniref:DUF2846 domain-containing protein n=1 Tax=Ignatzschineria rhizosphaerae TaxID=2923279 RepID=A0ABY3X139_9GAMM|nr:DUF2846 domain-containing protein [Ignatzschineria rhizosphaerae]UNM95481.1 DUF2846 domain-containing protein [Ignatzschineria rhizosphaerae]